MHTSVSQSFSQAAKGYDNEAFLQRKVADRLLQKLEGLNFSPTKILDAGCGTGYCTNKLASQFQNAEILGVDIALGMVEEAKRKFRNNNINFQCADINEMPFESDSFDLVFSSLAVQWIKDPEQAFSEINRIMKPGGVLLFSSMGKDTLIELKESWKKVDQAVHVNNFFEINQVACQVSQSRFSDVAVDKDKIIMKYEKMTDIMKNLKAIGAGNLNEDRNKGLQGKSKFIRLMNEYDRYRDKDGTLPATYDVIYCQAKKIIV